MADSARAPSLGLASWFYALAADGKIWPVPRPVATRVLARKTLHVPRGLPEEWKDRRGGLTLFGTGLVLQDGRPIYIERASVSFHALPRMRRVNAVTRLDFDMLAARISSEAGERRPNVS